ncbi:MAG: hypothetical protein QN163_00870 [Armatimonadota bacterium]|nr:hypothetical protein [Armatimonadota bacterium]MDR5697374.1 hypothetical protein [Armatimonadota bacterium]
MKCATHPAVETGLTCATCGTPICPDCLVQTPVGMKCGRCGIAPVPETLRVGSRLLAVVLLTGTGIGAAAGAVGLSILSGYVLLLILIGPAVGTLAGEGIRRVVGGRTGSPVAIAAAASVAIGLTLVAPNVLAVGQAGSVIPVDSLLLGLVQRPSYVLFVAGAAAGAFWRLR